MIPIPLQVAGHDHGDHTFQTEVQDDGADTDTEEADKAAVSRLAEAGGVPGCLDLQTVACRAGCQVRPAQDYYCGLAAGPALPTEGRDSQKSLMSLAQGATWPQ